MILATEIVKSLKKHWFYTPSHRNRSKEIGFIFLATENMFKTKTVVDTSGNTNRSKKWYIVLKSIDCVDRATEIIEKVDFMIRATEIFKKASVLQIGQLKSLKKHWFYKKTSPGNQATRLEPRIRGLELTYSFWIDYEEPLQPSCLRNCCLIF